MNTGTFESKSESESDSTKKHRASKTHEKCNIEQTRTTWADKPVTVVAMEAEGGAENPQALQRLHQVRRLKKSSSVHMGWARNSKQ